ncbi:MAG: hypothetical protein Q9218_000630 [Villophora microphyllina]
MQNLDRLNPHLTLALCILVALTFAINGIIFLALVLSERKRNGKSEGQRAWLEDKLADLHRDYDDLLEGLDRLVSVQEDQCVRVAGDFGYLNGFLKARLGHIIDQALKRQQIRRRNFQLSFHIHPVSLALLSPAFKLDLYTMAPTPQIGTHLTVTLALATTAIALFALLFTEKSP